MHRYRLRCVTDGVDEEVLSTTAPTVCPTDAGHTIDIDSISVIEQNITVPKSKVKSMSASDGDTLASSVGTYISTSGRTFLSHSGTGTSADYCGFTFIPDEWIHGARVWIDFSTGLDGVKLVNYSCQISVNNGGAQVQETVVFTNVLTDDTANYETLSTEVLEFSSAITDVLDCKSKVTLKVTRHASDDDYNAAAYTEIVNFEYNY